MSLALTTKSFICKTVLSLLSVFIPIQHTLTTVLFLVTADLILGIQASRKAGQPITSIGLRRTLVKLLTYELAIMIGFLAETYIPGSIRFANIIGGYISLTEVTSIMEHLNAASGGNLLTSIVNKLTNQDNTKS